MQLHDEIRRIQLRLGITTVFVTHDQEEALAIADRVGVMRAGQLEQIGLPEDISRSPATPWRCGWSSPACWWSQTSDTGSMPRSR